VTGIFPDKTYRTNFNKFNYLNRFLFFHNANIFAKSTLFLPIV
jgi:hypothetical protein